MSKRFDLVIFDCDGVLVNSETVAVKVVQRVLADIGWHLSIEEIIERFVGASGESFNTQVEEFLGEPLEPDWRVAYNDWYQTAFDLELRPVHGVEEVLDNISLPTCVASNSRHEQIQSSLAFTGLLCRFEGHIYSAEDVSLGKPAPDLFLHAAANMGAEPGRCLVVEDSRFGVQAARAAGMSIFGYAGGLTPSEWLEGPQTTVFTSMDQLARLIDVATHGQ